MNVNRRRSNTLLQNNIFNKTKNGINGLFSDINGNFKCMCITIPEDKKKILEKEIKHVDEKLEVVDRFDSVVKVVEEFVTKLDAFNVSLNTLDSWMKSATGEMEAIRAAAGSMLPEDRVARTMDLQEDIAAKLEILQHDTATELDLLPQGEI